jgi:cell division protein FtsL
VIFRLLNFLVIGMLVMAATYVYRVKYDATVQAEQLAKLRGEVRHERDKIAALRAEWEQLDNPARIEALAKRFLPLRPTAPTQFDSLDRLPEHSTPDVASQADPIGEMIENLEQSNRIDTTGSLPASVWDRAPGSRQ